jgi:Zn-dependent protease
MKFSLYLGRIAGIKIFIHWTFWILIAWTVYNDMQAGLEWSEILWSVGFILAVFVCVTLHELGHALAARRYHIGTHDITLLPIGGVAKLESIPEKPKEELVVALVGPAVNVAIALILLPFVHLNPESLESLAVISRENFLLTMMAVNVSLVAFNMIPAFPMDGGRVFRALLAFRMDRLKATRIASAVGQAVAVGFILLGFYGNTMLIFIGAFIFLAAQGEARYAAVQSHLKNFTLARVVMADYPTLDASASLGEAARSLLSGQNKNFLVVSDGRPVGVLSREDIVRGFTEGGEAAPVRSVMQREVLQFDVNTGIEQAWRAMQSAGKQVALVTEHGTVRGAVDSENIAEFLMLRAAGQQPA